MLTIFTVPKPFSGHEDVIQRNALSSWRKLDTACEIILCGNDAGVDEAAGQFDARHISDVARNEFGTPLLDSVFRKVHATASHHRLCYVNTDIILLGDFIEAVRRVELGEFVLVGQRWDTDLSVPWDFGDDEWESRLRRYLEAHATLHPPMGSDYFVFTRSSGLGELPRFAVGRPAWDNWFIHHALELGLPVVDLTRCATVVHQNHDYTHVSQRTGQAWEGPEADANRELAGGWKNIRTLEDATHFLTPEALESRRADIQLPTSH